VDFGDRFYKPVVLPADGTIIVRACNAAQAQLWIREQAPSERRRFVYASEARVVDGCRPVAIVLLPGWHDHCYVESISGALERCIWKLPLGVPRIGVQEAIRRG
jgi:hypothetical protein